MTQPLKLFIIAGARPNFMKVAPLMKAITLHNGSPGGRPRIVDTLIHTGQHYDEKMSDVFFRELGIRQPDLNLGVGSGSHAVQTATTMISFAAACEKDRPDWVVVVGDVNSTVACTLVSSKMGIKVAHVEAGLRSFDRTMPEELNRLVVDVLADLLLTPSEDGNENLQREGIHASKVRLVGNIMIDSLIENLEKSRAHPILKNHGLEPGRFAYVTLHRPANVDNRASLTSIMQELTRVAKELPVVFPIHPRTRKMLQEFGALPEGGQGMVLLEPVGYHESLCLTENARLVLTDSGGLQEEATYFRTPCLTLRPNTERPITIRLGSNRLTDVDRLRGDVEQALKGPARIGEVPPFWDGRTAQRTLDAILAASA